MLIIRTPKPFGKTEIFVARTQVMLQGRPRAGHGCPASAVTNRRNIRITIIAIITVIITIIIVTIIVIIIIRRIFCYHPPG